MSTTVLAAVLVGMGLAAIVVGVLAKLRSREDDLAAYLNLPYGEEDVPVEAVTESTLYADTIGLAGRMVDQFDAKGALRKRLERARVPMRPAEFVLVAAGAGLAAGLFVGAVTARPIVGALVFLFTPVFAAGVLDFMVGRRRRKVMSQLPEALSIIASSLAAGHTFLRSIQMMTEEAEPPLSEEFGLVVQETRLGAGVVDALDRMAHRMDIKDLSWVVQAIRIQQSVGGKLADLLHTLTEFMRAREEIRREISVLTAEGRISAWVLGGLPVFLMLSIMTLSPGYMDPLFEGKGWFVLIGTGLSIAAGVMMILKMVKIEV